MESMQGVTELYVALRYNILGLALCPCSRQEGDLRDDFSFVKPFSYMLHDNLTADPTKATIPKSRPISLAAKFAAPSFNPNCRLEATTLEERQRKQQESNDIMRSSHLLLKYQHY